MKLRTEIVGPDSTSAHPYPAARVDDDGQDYLHDAAAAHALMQAMDTWAACLADNASYVEFLTTCADELMYQWGFTDE